MFRFGGRDVADGLQQSPVVEPVDPFQGGVFDGLEGSPRPSSVDHLGLVEPVDRFGQGVVVTVPNAADRGLYPCFGQAPGVFDRYVLATPVAMMHKAASVVGATFVDSLLQGVQHKAGMSCSADPPTHDLIQAVSCFTAD